MKLLINLLPIKRGGGQQVAINFVKQLKANKCFGHSILCVTNQGSAIASRFKSHGNLEILTIRDNLIGRFYFEFFRLNEVIDSKSIEIIFTLFGPKLSTSKVPSVVGCAYSNLFYPEIDFWKNWSFPIRMRSKAIDWYRLKMTMTASAIIFENLSMRSRAISLFDYRPDSTIFIKPSLSSHTRNDYPSVPRIKKLFSGYESDFKILMLTGWHKNKNLGQVPNVLKQLMQLDPKHNYRFILTLDESHKESKKLKRIAENLGVEKYMTFIGLVNPEEVSEVYRQSNCTLLMSLLESFSNNIIESWEMRRPLLISDLEWARSICGDAAVYVDRDNPTDIAIKAIQLQEDSQYYNKIVSNGCIELKTYPSPKEKVERQLGFLENVLRTNK